MDVLAQYRGLQDVNIQDIGIIGLPEDLSHVFESV